MEVRKSRGTERKGGSDRGGKWKKGREEERKSWIKETAEEFRSRALAVSAVSFGEKNRSKPEDEKRDERMRERKNQTVDLIREKTPQCKTVVFLNGRRTHRQKTREIFLSLLLRRTERISSRSQA